MSKKYLHTDAVKNNFKNEIVSYESKAKFMNNMALLNDKHVDLTNEIQAVLNKYDVIVLPNHEIRINKNGLRLRSNQVVIFQEKTVLKSIPNSQSHSAVLIIDEVENVKIYNAHIHGERFEHLDSKGQWGMGIRIIASNDIRIINPTIKEMCGDGIYIGGRRGKPSKNVEIHNAHLDHNRRNAMSITSVDGLKLINPLIANANGQSPKAGIDIEPNSNDDTIDKILIENPISFYNSIYGIVISLTKLPGLKQKEVNVAINNPLIIGGKYGVAVLGIYKNPNNYKINGKISVNNLTTYYNALSIKEFDKPMFDLEVKISNLKIFHKSKREIEYLNQKQMDKFHMNLKILD